MKIHQIELVSPLLHARMNFAPGVLCHTTDVPRDRLCWYIETLKFGVSVVPV